MGIEKVVGVESDEPADQSTKGAVGLRADRCEDAAEEARQVVSAQRHARHDPKAAAAAALKAPVKIRVGAGIGDPHLPVRSDDLGLEEICSSSAELFGVAPESTRSHQPGATDR